MKLADDPKVAVVIVAAGNGLRAGGPVPKQFREVAGYTVAEWSLLAFANHPRIEEYVIVCPQDGSCPVNEERIGIDIVAVAGGDSRDQSVKLGLQAVSETCDLILIHDAARPCLPSEVIDAVLDALNNALGAAPALPVTDALWVGSNGSVAGVRSRDGLYRAQTPQGFHASVIREAHAAFDGEALDDVEVVRAAGNDVAIVEGSENNLKITGPEDFARAEKILDKQMDIRTGNGFDVHRFGPGDYVTLCGIDIPHDHGLQGHSDADVGLHTITDAIYGALAEGDIGQHFPPSDPQWKGAASHIFLEQARDLAAERGFQITHVDCTLVCEFPKIGPHASAMRDKVSELLKIDISRVSVKATTSERLGFTGRGEGIACMATATLVKS